MINENYKIYFAEFGEPVTYTGSSEVSKSILAIWDKQIINTFTDMAAENYSISCLVKVEDITDYKLNATIVRNSITYYTVQKDELDNDNMVLIELSKNKVT